MSNDTEPVSLRAMDVWITDAWRPLFGTGHCRNTPQAEWITHVWHESAELKVAGALYYARARKRTEAQSKDERVRAAVLIKDVAESGNPIGQYALGQWLATDLDLAGFAATVRPAAYWLFLASMQGHVNALVELGRCFAAGKGVPIKPEWAYRLFYKAAQYRDFRGEWELAECLNFGIGVVANKELAAHYYMLCETLQATRRLVDLGYTPKMSNFRLYWEKTRSDSAGQ